MDTFYAVQLSNYIFSEDQLAKLRTGKDVAIIFKEENLQKNRQIQVFKRALKIVGRNDLVVNSERSILTGKS